MLNLRTKAATLLLSAGVVGAVSAQQDYPNRPLRLLAPYGAGGSYDGLARVIGTKLGEQLGQQVIVDNRPGASGRIGMAVAVKMPPDGYNLLMLGNAQVVTPSFYAKVSYDLEKDIVPLTMIGIIAMVLVIHPSVNAQSVQELIALSKAKPGTIRFGSGGTGGMMQLAGELFKSMTGADGQHVPYKSAAQATNANVGGEIEMSILNMTNAAAQVRAGRRRGLAVTSLKRSQFLPKLPTLDESGVKGYESVEFYALALPAGKPNGLISRLYAEVLKAVDSSDVKEKYVHLSAEPVTMTPEQTWAFILGEQKKYARIVKEVGIKPE